ncbi:MAG: hypothetical protein U0Z17_06375 [Bacteroidales bacterium]
MKKEIEKHQQFKAVGFVMDKNAEAFAEKPISWQQSSLLQLRIPDW